MKHSIIAVGIFLIAGQVAAHPEQEGTRYTESVGDGGSSSSVMQPTKEVAAETEFSAMESIKQLPKRIREPLGDNYDYVPSSWYESY